MLSNARSYESSVDAIYSNEQRNILMKQLCQQINS